MAIIEQNTMSFNPGQNKVGQLDGIFRGKIVPNGVRFISGETKQTLVDVYIYALLNVIPGIPLLSGKINRSDGEEWTPEEGDLVAVMFFGKKAGDPIIIGYIPPANNEIQTPGEEKPRYYRKRSGTTLKIEKDGTERKYIKKDKVTVIEGQEQVTVNTGDISIDVVQGKCTVHVKGKTAWTSEGTVEIDGTNGTGVKGIVQGDSICPFTLKPHCHISASVKGSK